VYKLLGAMLNGVGGVVFRVASPLPTNIRSTYIPCRLGAGTCLTEFRNANTKRSSPYIQLCCVPESSCTLHTILKCCSDIPTGTSPPTQSQPDLTKSKQYNIHLKHPITTPTSSDSSSQSAHSPPFHPTPTHSTPSLSLGHFESPNKCVRHP
jgi:hypothetical protein